MPPARCLAPPSSSRKRSRPSSSGCATARWTAAGMMIPTIGAGSGAKAMLKTAGTKANESAETALGEHGPMAAHRTTSWFETRSAATLPTTTRSKAAPEGDGVKPHPRVTALPLSREEHALARVSMDETTGEAAEPAAELTRAGAFPQHSGDLVRGVGLWQKDPASRQVGFADRDMTRCGDDLDRRPFSPDQSGKLQAVHRTGQPDIRKDHLNVRSRFKDRNGLVGVFRLDDIEPAFADHFRRAHSRQELVFDDKNDRPLDRGGRAPAVGIPPIGSQRQRCREENPARLVAHAHQMNGTAVMVRRVLEDRRQETDGFALDHLRLVQFGADRVDVVGSAVIEVKEIPRHFHCLPVKLSCERWSAPLDRPALRTRLTRYPCRSSRPR